MSDSILGNLITGLTGLFGVIIGLIFNIIIQNRKDRRSEIKEKQIAIIDNFEEIKETIETIEFIFRAIDDFRAADFNNSEDHYENIEAITKLGALNLPKIHEDWKKIRKIIYQYFPMTVNSQYFDTFNKFLNEYDKFQEYLQENGDDIHSLQDHFRNSFQESYQQANTLLKIFNAEFNSITLAQKKIIVR